MAIPLIAAGVAAAASLASNYMNNRAQKKANKQSEQYARDMYEKQRQDNEKQWHMQNSYNDPQSQMNRLRQGGLNPNLIYGSGGGTTQAAPMPSASPQAWSPTAPQTDLSGVAGGLDQYFNFQMKDAQIDNLKTQNTVNTQEAILKAAQTSSTIQNTARSKFDLELASDLRQTSADAARESLRKLQIDNTFQLDENERRTIQNSQSLVESAERILTMREQRATSVTERSRIRQQINNLRNDDRLQQLDIELRQNGIQPNDPIYFRALGRILGAQNISIKNSWEKTNPIPEIKDTFNKIFKRSNWLPKKR